MISYSAMAAALQEGYATSSTDTGHDARNPDFAVGHPEKVVDFSHRAVHEMTVKAKAIMTHRRVDQMIPSLCSSQTMLIRPSQSTNFDPKELECKDADGPACLTPAQVETARAIYTA